MPLRRCCRTHSFVASIVYIRQFCDVDGRARFGIVNPSMDPERYRRVRVFAIDRVQYLGAIICDINLSRTCGRGVVRVISKRTDMINVVLHSSSVSFIKCCAGSTAFDVVSDFDIDICTPIVVREGGALCVHMTPSVAESITDLKMHRHIRKRQPRFMQYPLQRSLNRIRKYVSRGYSFASLTFHSTTHIDFPDRDAESSLFVEDFLHVPSPSMNCSCVVIETMDD
jgi:hypothetical protein